jgi:large subunit ribosomal protein L29
MAKVAELREMDDDELHNRLAEAKQELFNLRFQHVTGQLDNYARLGQVRRSVAQINGLLREREIAAAEAGELPAGSGPTATQDEDRGRRGRRRGRMLGGRRSGAETPEVPEDEGENGG